MKIRLLITALANLPLLFLPFPLEKKNNFRSCWVFGFFLNQLEGERGWWLLQHRGQEGRHAQLS